MIPPIFIALNIEIVVASFIRFPELFCTLKVLGDIGFFVRIQIHNEKVLFELHWLNEFYLTCRIYPQFIESICQVVHFHTLLQQLV